MFDTNVKFGIENRQCTVDKESIPEYYYHLRCSPGNPGFVETAKNIEKN